jgi:Sec-independent protein secretion pathway component TatC
MMIMAVPMWGLYLISIVIAFIFGKRKKRPQADPA